MRAKRIVSVLLAAIMLMGMIPMNAMAALTPDNPSKKDMAEFKLMISDSFGAVLPGQNGKNIDIKTAAIYKNLSRNANYDSVFDKNTTDAKILKTNLEKCESVFTPDEDGVLDGVEPGSTIYVGVKAKIMNPETYKGVVAYGAYIKYDATKFEPIVGNAVGSGEAAKKAYQGTVITNHLGAGTLNSSAGLNDEYELVNSDDVTKYFGSYKLDTASAIGVDEGDPNIEYLGVVTKSANINYFPSESTWDFIVPMKVKAGVSGTANFEIVSKANMSFTEVVLSKGVYDGATDLQGDTVKTAINDSETTTRNCIASNDVTVKIAGPGITAGNVGTSATSVQVTANEYCTLKSAQDVTDWTLTSDSAFVNGKQPKSVVVNGNVATLTFPDDTVLVGEEVTVTAAAAAFASGATAPVSTTFTVLAEPAATAVVAADGSTVTLNSVDATMEYKIGGEDATGDYTAISTTSKVLSSAELAGLIEDNKIYVRFKADADNIAVKTLTVAQQETPTAATVNYANETVTPNAAGDTFKIGTGNEHVTSNTDAVDISSEIPANGNPALDIVTYKKGGDNKIQSKSVTTTGAIKARPVFATTPTSSDSDKVNGNTVLANVTATDKYAVTISSETNAPAWITGGTLNSTYTEIGAELKVKASTAQKVWLMKPATASTFASAPVAVDGKGNPYGTVTVEPVAMEAKSVVLKIVGDTFVVANKDNITVTKDSGSNLVSEVNLSDGDTTATLTTSALGEGTYTVTIPANAVAGNIAVNNGAAITFTVSNNGYVVELGGAKHNGADGSSFTFDTVTGWQPSANEEGKLEISYTMTNAYEKLEDSCFTVSPAGIGKVEVDKENRKIIFTPANAEDITDKKTVTVNVDTKIQKYTITLNDLSVTDVTKEYDGSDVATPTVAIDPSKGITAFGKTNVTVEAVDGYAFADKNAGASKAVSANKGFKIADASTDKDYFELDAALKTLVEISNVGEITAIEITGIDAEPSTKKYTNSQAQLIQAIKDATLTINSIDSDVLSNIMSLSDEGLAKYADGAVIRAGSYVSETHEVDLTESKSGSLAIKAGDTIKLTIDEDKTIGSVSTLTGYTLKDGTSIESGLDAITGTLTVTYAEGGTSTIEITAINAPVADYNSVVGKDLEVEILSQFVDTTMQYRDKLIEPYATNYGDGLDALDLSFTISPIVLTKKSTGPSTTQYTVTYDEGEHGVITSGSTFEVVDEGMYPTAVPTVTPDDTYTFLGWSKDGTNVVNPTSIAVTADVTYTALYKRGFIQGDGDGKVRPNNSINRAEFTKMLVTASGKFDPQAEYADPEFTDVKSTAWYAPYVACAVENGIVKGYTDNTFKPTASITREEAAQMIYNAVDGLTEVDTTDKIKDFNRVGNWAKPAVATLVEAGILTGYTDGTFKPQQNITRAEATVIVCRIEGFEPDEDTKEDIKNGYESPFKDLNKTNWAYSYILYASGELDDTFYG